MDSGCHRECSAFASQQEGDLLQVQLPAILRSESFVGSSPASCLSSRIAASRFTAPCCFQSPDRKRTTNSRPCPLPALVANTVPPCISTKFYTSVSPMAGSSTFNVRSEARSRPQPLSVALGNHLTIPLEFNCAFTVLMVRSICE